jgi:hypothetical protein
MYYLRQKTTGQALCSYASYAEAEQARKDYKLNGCYVDYSKPKSFNLTSLDFESVVFGTAKAIVFSIPVMVVIMLLNF